MLHSTSPLPPLLYESSAPSSSRQFLALRNIANAS